MQDGRSAVNQNAARIKDTCVAVAINGHMLHWLMKTDGENGGCESGGCGAQAP